MSDYLDCGHPRGCIAPDDDFRATGKTHCAACERDGWVYCCPEQFEGLPPIGLAIEIALADAYDWTRTIYGYRANDEGVWCNERGETVDEQEYRIYAWRKRPAPPPLPETLKGKRR